MFCLQPGSQKSPTGSAVSNAISPGQKPTVTSAGQQEIQVGNPFSILSLQTSKISVSTFLFKSLMAEWLRQASQGHKMYCSLSGGHGFKPWPGLTWGAHYFCQRHI